MGVTTGLAAEFGERVNAWRTRSNLTLTQLAERAGMSKTGVWEIEKGLSMPGIDTALKLAGALGVPVGELIEGTSRDRPGLRDSILEKISELHLLARSLI